MKRITDEYETMDYEAYAGLMFAPVRIGSKTYTSIYLEYNRVARDYIINATNAIEGYNDYYRPNREELDKLMRFMRDRKNYVWSLDLAGCHIPGFYGI